MWVARCCTDSGSVNTSVTLLVQYICNTVGMGRPADCKSAMQQTGGLRYASVRQEGVRYGAPLVIIHNSSLILCDREGCLGLGMVSRAFCSERGSHASHRAPNSHTPRGSQFSALGKTVPGAAMNYQRPDRGLSNCGWRRNAPNLPAQGAEALFCVRAQMKRA